MSSSESNTVQLTVQASTPATEIFLMDGTLHLIDRAVGTMSVQLAPGIYKVKARAGTATVEEQVVLRESDSSRELHLGPIEFPSAAPLYETAKTHEFHEGNARDASREVHVRGGEGSYLFFFARDWTTSAPTGVPLPAYPHPTRGLTLHDQEGSQVADLEAASKSNLQWDPWAACNVQVDPGIYRLRLNTGAGLLLEQAIVAAPGWQTQVFLLQRPYSRAGADSAAVDRRADVTSASILLARGLGFDPYSTDVRLADQARLALVNNRDVLSSDMRAMLTGKFENPMLGIYGGLLLLRAREPDLDLLRTVVGNLRAMLGAHPDVEALAWRAGFEPELSILGNPPMLRKSWELILEASVQRPDLVPMGSLGARIADRLWGDSPWLLWISPDAAPPDAASLSFSPAPNDQPDDPMEDYRTALRQVLWPTSRRSATRGPSETPAALSFGVGVSEPVIDDAQIQRLVQTLRLPRAVIDEMLSTLKP